jgi:hypothetical protein
VIWYILWAFGIFLPVNNIDPRSYIFEKFNHFFILMYVKLLHKFSGYRALLWGSVMNLSMSSPRLPDFYWCKNQNWGKCTKMAISILAGHKIYQNSNKIPNGHEAHQIHLSQGLTKYTEIGIFGLKNTIWQPCATLYVNCDYDGWKKS